MKTAVYIAALGIGVALSGTARAEAPDAGNSAWAGFARMLDHQPYYGPTATTVSRDEPDPVAAVIRQRLSSPATDARRPGAQEAAAPVLLVFGNAEANACATAPIPRPPSSMQ